MNSSSRTLPRGKQFGLSAAFIALTAVCVVCGFLENINRHWLLLGELSGNYTRLETHAYWIGFQGSVAGFTLCLAVVMTIKLLHAKRR